MCHDMRLGVPVATYLDILVTGSFSARFEVAEQV